MLFDEGVRATLAFLSALNTYFAGFFSRVWKTACGALKTSTFMFADELVLCVGAHLKMIKLNKYKLCGLN